MRACFTTNLHYMWGSNKRACFATILHYMWGLKMQAFFDNYPALSYGDQKMQACFDNYRALYVGIKNAGML